MTSGPPAILVRDLRKSYGELEAVRGIDFEVATGEVFGLLGPNGAGKTTTVEILEGYRRRSGGIVSVLGHDPGERSRAMRERVGIVLQSCGMYRHVKVHEAVAYWAGLYPHPRDVDEVIEIVGLTEKREALARTLSGGQARRLDLALALVGDPELVFLDEPTTGFDPAARRTAWGTVRRLQDLGKTVLLTTHYLDEAQALCDRVAIVKDGRILAEGPPATLGAAASRYRVTLARRARRAPDARGARPHAAPAPAHQRRAGPGRGAARPVGHTSQPRGRLPRADRRGRRPGPRRRGARGMSATTLAWRHFRLERKMFWRNPTAAFFSFVLPLIFLVLFGAISDQENLKIIVPGIAGLSVMATTFNALANQMTFLRDAGVLKRMHGTPLPGASYLAGVLGNAATNAAVQVGIIVLASRFAFDLGWPQNWLDLAVFTILGVACFASLGVAFSHVIPNFDAAPAYTNIVFLPVIFISGVFYDVDTVPAFLRDIADALPLVHVINGFEGAFVTGAGLDDLVSDIAVILLWTALGVWGAVRGFRWDSD